MTNSHNRENPGGRYTNASPQHQNGNVGVNGGNGNKRRQQQKSPTSANYFNSLSTSSSNSISISPPKLYGSNNNGRYYNSYTSYNMINRTSPGGSSIYFTTTSPIQSSSVSSSPPNLSYFAGSKCFEAPEPTALPKPPRHWTINCGGLLTTSTTSTINHNNDDFSHNLKMMLNVQA